jgi:hypothetical protein
MKSLLLLASIFALFALSDVKAEGTFVGRGNAHCPQFDGTRSWRGWFSGEYEAQDHTFTHPASIRFDHLKSQLGPFKPNTCYTIVYEKGVWSTTLSDGNGPRGASGADPSKWEMNLAGRVMTFNNFGQVIDKELGVVGTLKCGLGPDC